MTFRMPALLVLLLLGCASEAPSRDTRTVLFLTDFGLRDGAVALCKGVMWDIEPNLRIVDVSHDVPPYDIETAGEVLE
jgi:S-adenosylmethionine hydrolase